MPNPAASARQRGKRHADAAAATTKLTQRKLFEVLQAVSAPGWYGDAGIRLRVRDGEVTSVFIDYRQSVLTDSASPSPDDPVHNREADR